MKTQGAIIGGGPDGSTAAWEYSLAFKQILQHRYTERVIDIFARRTFPGGLWRHW
jgi:hypothetical protein